MEQVLGGMSSICVMLDDVLVTGKDDVEHLHNLEEVFNRFMKYGLRLKREVCVPATISQILWFVYIKRGSKPY